MTVTIVQLYPRELGVAGDRGNVLALAARLGAAGFESETVEYSRGDSLPVSADLIVIGNGPLSAMRTVHADLLSIASRLRGWVADGVPVFAYGAGAELLGHGIDLLDGSRLDGLGIFPLVATRTASRKVGYIIADSAVGQLVGFEDNASIWTPDAGAETLGTVTAGIGNGDGREGVLSGSSIATQLGGPVLPLNPELTALLVNAVAARRGVAVAAAALGVLDEYAENARNVIIANATHHFSRI